MNKSPCEEMKQNHREKTFHKIKMSLQQKFSLDKTEEKHCFDDKLNVE